MKIKPWLMISFVGAALQWAPVTFSQDSEQTGKGWRHNQQGRLANLSPDERQKVEAARQKAMQDPTAQTAHAKMEQARKEFRDAMHAAMLKADPSIQSILDKMPMHEKPGD